MVHEAMQLGHPDIKVTSNITLLTPIPPSTPKNPHWDSWLFHSLPRRSEHWSCFPTTWEFLNRPYICKVRHRCPQQMSPWVEWDNRGGYSPPCGLSFLCVYTEGWVTPGLRRRISKSRSQKMAEHLDLVEGTGENTLWYKTYSHNATAYHFFHKEDSRKRGKLRRYM